MVFFFNPIKKNSGNNKKTKQPNLFFSTRDSHHMA